MSRFICNTLLLTNDDGFDAPGLKILEKVCQRLAKEVWVVAPACDRSGTSQSLSLHTPLRFRQKGVHRYVVEGTPADCVAMAVRHLMIDSPPDFILSGINRGANIGNETIFSGTVGAAMTGVLLGFRAIALSQYFNNRHNIHWDTAEHASEIVLKYLIQGRWDYGTC
ncbi:5'/3'-nucleotidase SurE [Klebsiella pneumoniae]|nr:5'/3'-nucleotidase SurE [Klebsiella pneumoniae]